jgi:hypothetical protein
MTQGKGDEIEMISLDEILVKQKADTSKYKVAVCVTSYNQQDVIEDALNGILKQKTTFPFLIVVGDDYSTDGTRDILKRYKEQYPDTIELILQPHNLGLFKNRKEIFKSCDAPYIAFCDGDDYWTDETCLQKKYDFLEKHVEYIGYQTACFDRQGNEITDVSDLDKLNCFFDFRKENALKNDYPGQVGGFFFRNIYKYMSNENFEAYTEIPVDDSGKLPIISGIIAPIFRQDKNVTFIYRVCNDSMSRQEEKRNTCKQIFVSHLLYQSMIDQLNIKEKMQIDDQLIIIATNAFFTALKSSFRKSGKGNWNQFIYIYNYGYFDKRKIRREILRLFLEKIRNRG